MTDDDLGRAAATALKVRFPEPDGMDLLGSLRIDPTHARQRTLLAAAACVAAVVVVTVVALALSAGGSRHPVASAPPPANSRLTSPLQQAPGCRPGADVIVRLGGDHLLGNRVPVKAGVNPGDVVQVIARFGSRHLTAPATQSQALHAICSTGSSTYFRAVHSGSATVTSGTTGCNGCMQIQFAAHIAVVGNNKGCCAPSSDNAALLKAAIGAARGQGAAPETITAVRSTHAHAVRVIMGAGVSGNEPVWVLQIKATHDFACKSCSRPAGAAAPRGRYIQLVLDASSLRTLDTGITEHAADLSKLGHVITLFSR